MQQFHKIVPHSDAIDFPSDTAILLGYINKSDLFKVQYYQFHQPLNSQFMALLILSIMSEKRCWLLGLRRTNLLILSLSL